MSRTKKVEGKRVSLSQFAFGTFPPFDTPLTGALHTISIQVASLTHFILKQAVCHKSGIAVWIARLAVTLEVQGSNPPDRNLPKVLQKNGLTRTGQEITELVGNNMNVG